MPETKYKMDLDNAMLAYVFDPDQGMAEEITATLNTMAEGCEGIEAEIQRITNNVSEGNRYREPALKMAKERLEIAEGQLEFYTDVWTKIRSAVEGGWAVTSEIGSNTVDILDARGQKIITVTPQTQPAAFSLESQLTSDIGLFNFLVHTGQREFHDSYDQERALAAELISRGWHK